MIYFVRHGESVANLLNEFSNRGWKHGLTAKGKEQAQKLALKLQGVSFANIYTSPLRRAVETAEILSDVLQIPFEINYALTEFDVGVLESQSDDESWTKYNNLFTEWFIHKRWDVQIAEGESFHDIMDRFLPFIDLMKKEYLVKNEKVLLIGHGGTYRCMLPLVLSNLSFDFALKNKIENTDYVLAELHQSQLICRRWGAIEFKE